MPYSSPIDLHCHSTYSDGELSPSALLTMASTRAIKTLALTDHDSIDGLVEAQNSADTLGIKLITGVEISVLWNTHVIHLLGFGFDPDNSILKQGLLEQQQCRRERGKRMSLKLEQFGVKNAYADACQLAGSDLLSRTHLAHLLVKRGYAKNSRQVFKKFLVSGKTGYVASHWISLATGLSWLQAAGGYGVIAHPARYRLSRTQLCRLLVDFKALGGVGLEVVSGSHQQDETLQMAHFAQHYGFYATGGSDYHGPKHTWLELGSIPALPPQCHPLYNNAGDLLFSA